MAKIEFTIKGPKGGVTVRAFLQAFGNQLAILNDLDAVLSGKPKGLLDWFISDLDTKHSVHGVLQSSYREDEDDAPAPVNHDRNVARVYRNGLQVFEGEGHTPPYYIERDVLAARATFRLIGREGISGYSVRAGNEQPVEITARAAVNADQLVRPGERTTGGVEGQLVAISVRATTPRFTVIDAVTHKSVSCHFTDAMMEEVKAALGKRVYAFGDLLYNWKREPKKITVDALRVMPEGATLPTADDLIREIGGTSDMSTKDYLDLVRGSN